MITAVKREDLTETVREAISKAGVFYSEGYCRYLQSEGAEPWYVFDDDYAMLIVVKKRGPFRFARLPVEYVRHSQEGQAGARLFLDSCMEYCRDVQKLHWIHHPESAARFQETPTHCVRIPYSNHILDTTCALDDIWSALGKKNRNRIKKARSLGVNCKLGGIELLEDFYGVYVKTLNRSDLKPLPIRFFANQFPFFGSQIRLAVAYHEGIVQGAEFCYYDSRILYCMYGANEHPAVQGASNLLHWILIEDAVSQGIQEFSLVGARVNPAPGSKYEGINNFKSRIIPDVEPCCLFKVVLDPAMYKLFRILDRMRSFLGQGGGTDDIIDQEIGQWLDMNDQRPLYDVYGKNVPRCFISQVEEEREN